MINKYSKYKYILLLIISLAFPKSTFPASISLFDIDASKFPEMSAKAFFLDDKGESIPIINNSDIQIDENGTARNIQSIDCPSPKPPEALSAVLTIDVSGSMIGSGIQIASSAAKAFINNIPLGKSEVAITSFDMRNYLNCNFTTDKQTLLFAIDKLSPMGGTDFNAGLLNKMFGSLIIAEKGQHKKVIIFLTDGFASGDENEIINTANDMDAVIYCVVIAQKAPEILKRIAQRTGGEYFENIRTASEAEKCYKDILNKAQGGEPCVLKWQSGGCPDNRRLQISYPQYNISAFDYYSVDYSLLPSLTILPSESIRFGGLEPGTYDTKKIRIINRNDIIKIDSISGTHPQFKILDFPVGGIILNPNEEIELTIQFLPFDSAYKFSRFTVHSNACLGNFFYASGGFYGAKSSLVVDSPNGGESFQAGIDTLITWKGIPESDSVKIELSIDGGFTWKQLTTGGIGLKHKFIPPNIESDKCLIRIKQLETMGSRMNSFRVHTFTAKSVSISPNSKLIATSGEERNFNIYDITTGKLEKSISSTLIFKKVKFSPDGKYLATSVSDYSLEIYNTNDWTRVKKIEGKTSWIDDFVFSANSQYVATIADEMSNRRIMITDLNTNKSTYTNGTHGAIINNIITNFDGTQIISTSDDGIIKLWDFASGNKIKSIYANNKLKAISLSPEGARISVLSSNGISNDINLIKTFDLKSGQLLNSINLKNDQFTDIEYSYDGQSIVASTLKGYLYFYSADNYDSLRNLRINSFIINDIEWSKDSKYLTAITNEGNLHLINFEIILQEDISDDNFTITKANFIKNKIQFSPLRVGEIKDSIFIDAFRNNSNFPIIIKGHKFISGDVNAFAYVSYTDTVLANSSAKIELRFLPIENKAYNSIFRLYLNSDSVDITVSGIGYNQFYTEFNKILDFGKIPIDFTKDTLFKVFKNNSNKTITINSVKINGYDYNSFSFKNNFDNTISNEEDFLIPISFLPLERGIANTILQLYTDYEDAPVEIQLIGEGISDCGAESINRPNIRELKNIDFIGDAYMSDSLLVLNQAKDQSLGGIRLANLVPIDSGFYLTMKFSITDPYQFSPTEYSYPGADGISIVINNSNERSGITGGGMGYTGLKNAMAVEIDLFANDKNQIEDYNDPNGNHIAIMKIPLSDSTLTSFHKNNNVLATETHIESIRSDGSPYYLKIEYDNANSKFNVFFDTNGEFITPVISISDFNFKDIIKLFDNRGAFISIFGVSGSSYQTHKLHSLRLCTYLNAQPVYSSIDFEDYSNDIMFNYKNQNKTVELQSKINTPSEISIINGMGKVEKIISLFLIENQPSIIPVEFLSNGFYIFKIQYGNKILNQKFIKY